MNERELFIAALQIDDPAKRSAFLDTGCDADAELRRRVEALLQAFVQAGDFLLQPAAAGATSAMPPGGQPLNNALAEAPGTVIGPYKLLQQIGEGGMGTVYMAEQTVPVQRKVALKLIKAGLDSQQVIARFEAERQALALMDHPNIAKVLDAGTTEGGRPYFVMELVKGLPVTKYCDEHHLTPRKRLELFVPVCQAVQHAHQKGIIHRDLKPSNIMVCLYDGKPVPKVIDFGIAKATGTKLTERTLFTEFGAVVGTLEYMSPEQAELNQLDIDTRSDIYSLGVLFYELLTGTTPLERGRLKEAAFLEVLRLIREEEPPKPSTRLSTTERLPSIAANRGCEPKQLGGLVRGELDWIAMKCLEKDRNRRYESASGLALDIGRYLADEPVEACPPSAAYRLRTLVRRNRGPVLAGAIVAAALMAGIVGTTLALIQARHERSAFLEQRNAAEAAEKIAKIDAAIAQATASFLFNDLLAQADTDWQPMGRRDPDIKVRTLLDRASEEIDGRFPDMPLVEAAIHVNVGLTYRALGLFPEAQRHLEQAVRIRTKELGAEHPATLSVRRHMAIVYSRQAKFAQAEALFGPILDAQTQQLGADHDETLLTMRALGRTQYDLGKYDEAEKTLQASVADARKSGLVNEAVLNVDLLLALIFRTQAKYDQAEQLLNEVIDASTKLYGADHSLVMIGKTGLGWVYSNQRKFAEAESLLRDTLKSLEANLGAEHADTLNCKHNLANACADVEKDAEAEQLYKEVIQARAVHHGVNHRDTLASQHMLADIYAKTRRYAEAESMFEQVIEASTASLGPNHPDTLHSKRTRADLLLCREPDKWAEALEVFRADLQRAEQHAAKFPNEPIALDRLAAEYSHLGKVLADMSKWTEALDAYRRTLAIRAKLVEKHPNAWQFRADLGSAYCNTASTLRDSGEYLASLDDFAKALGYLEPLQGAATPRPEFICQALINTHQGRALALDALGRGTEATESFRSALAIQERLVNELPHDARERRNLGITYMRVGLRLGDQGLSAEAEVTHRVAVLLWEELVAKHHMPDDQINLGGTYCNLGNALLRIGNPAESLGWYSKALDCLQTVETDDKSSAATASRYLRNAHRQRADALEKLNRHADALEAVDAALAILQPLVRDQPDHPELMLELATTQNAKAALLFKDRATKLEAIDALRASLALQQKVAAANPNVAAYQRNLANDYCQLGNMLRDLGNLADAVEAYRVALPLQAKLASEFPAAPEYRSDEAASHNNLGALLSKLGKRKEAMAELRLAVELRKRLTDEFPTVPEYTLGMAGSYCNLGQDVRDIGNPVESLDWFTKAIECLDRLPAEKQTPDSVARHFRRNAHMGRAQALSNLNRHDEGLPDWDKAVDLSGQEERIPLRAMRADSLIRTGKTPEAIAEVAELSKVQGWDLAQLYNFACIYAQAAADDNANREQHAHSAIDLLRRAVREGFNDVAHLKSDSDLESLRQRDDFQELLKELH